jgi:methionyl-tRNA synthetase
MLLSIGMPLPKCVFAHGWWTADGKKMSKSLGNFVDIERLRAAIAKFGLDGLRYYLLRAAPFGSDLDWSDADLAKSHNELSNVLGNCLNRALKMIANSFGSVLPPIEGPLDDLDKQILEKTKALAAEIAGAYERLELQKCAMIPMDLARAVNGYIDATAPFKLAKDPATLHRAKTVLHISAQAIYRVLAALMPILPEKAVEGLAQMNINPQGVAIGDLLNKDLAPGHVLQPPSPLFPRV